MQWEFIIALLIGIPIILFPAALIWYINVGGVFAFIKERMARRVAREKVAEAATRVK